MVMVQMMFRVIKMLDWIMRDMNRKSGSMVIEAEANFNIENDAEQLCNKTRKVDLQELWRLARKPGQKERIDLMLGEVEKEQCA